MSTPKFCVLLLILAQIATIVSPATALDSQSEADLAISDAEEVMASAYQTIKEAETAGSDISGVSELLEDATQLLAQAHTSFRIGDFDNAVRFANLTSKIGREVEGMTYPLGEIKRGLPVWEMWLTVLGSFFAVSTIVLTIPTGE